MATTTGIAKRSRNHRETLASGPGGPWTAQAPRWIRDAYRRLGDEEGWAAWRKHLAQRKRPAAAYAGKRSPLAWALPDDVDGSSDTLRLINLLSKLSERANRKSSMIANIAEDWLHGAATAQHDAALGLECLAWATALVRLARRADERVWWAVWTRLVTIAGQVAGQDDAVICDPLAAQLLAGELPLVLAHMFPELESCRALAPAGRRTIDSAIAELVDGEGLPHGKYLQLIGPLLACWTRSCSLADEGWSDAVRLKFRKMVQFALRFLRPDGRATFAADGGRRWHPNLFKSAIRLADDATTVCIARLVDGKQNRSRKMAADLPSLAIQSEQACVALARCEWRRQSPRLAVTWAGGQVATELACGHRRLWSGAWQIEVRADGQLLEPRGEWEHVCWESNDYVDYLELAIELGDEVTVERHMLLARRDRFLLVADTVIGVQPAKLEYRGTLPLAAGATFQREVETREGSLIVGKRARARVLPLALAEWRAARTCGSLHAGERGLELTQVAEGPCLFAPLFVDLDARRIKKPLTWRQLTVAEDRAIVPADTAVGHRVQIGNSQWLVYRSLEAPAIRTVLGKNLMHEFLVGRFHRDGGVETLLEIE